MEGGSQEIKTENGHASPNGCMMDDSPLNPWPPVGRQRSGSGSSASSQNTNDLDDLMVNKVNSMAGKCTTQLPQVNVPEKIVICLDMSTDKPFTHFRYGDGTKFTPLAMIKRIINIFTYNKKMLNTNHQFALLLIHDESATWIQDFTQDPQEVSSILSNLSESTQPEEFDLSLFFDTIKEHVELPPKVDDLTKIPPLYNVRVILLYARSKSLPVFVSGTDSFDFLRSSPYFFFDLMYVHEPITDDNKALCEEIFQLLCTRLCTDTSYVFNVARNTTKLHDCMSKFLAHSLQRPKQEDADYKLLPDGI